MASHSRRGEGPTSAPLTKPLAERSSTPTVPTSAPSSSLWTPKPAAKIWAFMRSRALIGVSSCPSSGEMAPTVPKSSMYVQ